MKYSFSYKSDSKSEPIGYVKGKNVHEAVENACKIKHLPLLDFLSIFEIKLEE